jgi:hypothetical protein
MSQSNGRAKRSEKGLLTSDNCVVAAPPRWTGYQRRTRGVHRAHWQGRRGPKHPRWQALGILPCGGGYQGRRRGPGDVGACRPIRRYPWAP